MLDLIELMSRLTPGRLWKRTQIVECAASELDRLQVSHYDQLYKILYESATSFDCRCRDRRLAILELNCCFRIGIIRENKHRRTTVFAMTQTDARIAELVARLTALERERADVVAEINTLRSMRSEETEPIQVVPSGNAGDSTDRHSPIEKKLALFRRLFRGRSDVYPIRWENRTTGRSGYAPACANEWRRGICEKPRVKCSACPNQALSWPSWA